MRLRPLPAPTPAQQAHLAPWSRCFSALASQAALFQGQTGSLVTLVTLFGSKSYWA